METVTVIKKNPTCAELVDEQWKDRQEDLKNPEYEALGFDYDLANALLSLDQRGVELSEELIGFQRGFSVPCAKVAPNLKAFVVARRFRLVGV